MKIICVGNAIKEVMGPAECLKALERGVELAQQAVRGRFITSDGGDGFLEAIAYHREVREVAAPSLGALGDEIETVFVVDEPSSTAYIESAKVIGLAMVAPERRNIMISGTAGLADAIWAAKQTGVKRIVVGLGGSATCDGGVGMLWRLAELCGLCRFGCPEIRTALDMADLPPPDILSLRNTMSDVELIACTDVDNPLLGPEGAVYTFAAQKGANPEQIEQLEPFMQEWAERVERNGEGSWKDDRGAGAAGGLGFALRAIGAKLQSGARLMARDSGLEKEIAAGATVLTAEGKFDNSSLHGKAPWVVSQLAVEKGATAVIFCGVCSDEARAAAAERGVKVVEYGAGMSLSDISGRSGEKLSEAVKSYLTEAVVGRS